MSARTFARRFQEQTGIIPSTVASSPPVLTERVHCLRRARRRLIKRHFFPDLRVCGDLPVAIPKGRWPDADGVPSSFQLSNLKSNTRRPWVWIFRTTDTLTSMRQSPIPLAINDSTSLGAFFGAQQILDGSGCSFNYGAKPRTSHGQMLENLALMPAP